MTQPSPPDATSPGSGGGASDYDLYIRTAQVEQAWPEIPGWPLSSRLGPLLVSFEITLKIFQESLEEASKRLYLNNGQKCDAIAVCLNLQLRLMTQLASQGGSSGGARQISNAAPPDNLFGPASRESAWRTVMEKLGRMQGGDRLRAELKLRYESLVDALGFELGLNESEGLDYDKFVQPEKIHGLYDPDRREMYPDDAMFVRIHQASEGLLEAALVELRGAEKSLYKVDYMGAESQLLMAARCARSLDSMLNLLGEMSQVDYAPLRLAQRDVDISQSMRWQAGKSIIKDHFWLFRQQLKDYGLNFFLVLADRSEHVVEHRLLQAFKTLSRAMQESLSNHAHLMQNIQGTAMVAHVDPDSLTSDQPGASPLLPDLIEAFDQLTLWTSLKFANHTGAVIREQEERLGLGGKYEFEPPGEPCARSRKLRTIERLFTSLREGDMQTWLGVFTDPSYLEDPRGSRPSITRQDLAMRLHKFHGLFPSIESCDYQILTEGENSLQLQWTVTGTSFLGGIQASAMREQIFYFDPEGRICASIAEWEPETLADQLMEQHREAMLDAIGKID